MSKLSPDTALAAIQGILDAVKTSTDDPAVAPATWDDLLSQARTIPAERKIEIIRAMGFSPTGSDHQWDCMHQFDSGIRCNCVRPATVWSQPDDVDAFRGETLDERLNDKRDRRIPDCER